jgi:hypothetical protein
MNEADKVVSSARAALAAIKRERRALDRQEARWTQILQLMNQPTETAPAQYRPNRGIAKRLRAILTLTNDWRDVTELARMAESPEKATRDALNWMARSDEVERVRRSDGTTVFRQKPPGGA